MRVRIENEFIPLNVAVVLLIIFNLFPASILRALLVLPFVFFFPGYCLTTILAPAKDDLSIIARIGISLGVSLFLTPIIGFLFNCTPWGISVPTLLFPQAVLIFLLSVIAWQRKKRLPPDKRFIIDFQILVAKWRKETSNLDRALNVILVFSLMSGLFSLGYTMLNPNVGERFTEFYILGLADVATGYPKEIVVGSEAKVKVGIVNREGNTINYRVVIRIGTQEVGEGWSVTLHDGDKIEHEMTFMPYVIGKNQKVEFLLYRENDVKPYRSIYFWIDVRSTEERFTLFYFTGYPDREELLVGRRASIKLKIENYEGEIVLYHVTLLESWAEESRQAFSVELSHGEKWEQEVYFVPLSSGRQRLTFVLFKEESQEEIKRIFLDIPVQQEIAD